MAVVNPIKLGAFQFIVTSKVTYMVSILSRHFLANTCADHCRQDCSQCDWNGDCWSTPTRLVETRTSPRSRQSTDTIGAMRESIDICTRAALKGPKSRMRLQSRSLPTPGLDKYTYLRGQQFPGATVCEFFNWCLTF